MSANKPDNADLILKKLESIDKSIKSIDQRLNSLERTGPKQTGAPVLELAPVLAQKTEAIAKPKPVVEGPKIAATQKSQISESEIGFKWFAWIGIAAVAVSAGFLVLYAIQNRWISPLAQVLLGVAIGLLILAAGYFIEKRGLLFHSKVFFAGGFPVIFYSLFAGHQFYSLFPFEIATALITLVVFAAAFLAYKKNSLTIACESFFLGFMLPLITQKLDFFMLIYALILLAAIIALFTRKRWAVVYFEGIAATFFLYAVWTLKNFGYEAAQAGDIVLFMMGFYALFSIGAILFASEKKNFLAGATLHLFASIWFYWAISDIFTVHFPGLHLLFRIAFLLIALLLAAFARKSLSIQKSDWHVVVPFAAAGFLTLFNVMPLLMMLIAFSLFFVVFASREEHTLLVPARLVSVVAFVFVFATLFWLKNFSFDDLWAYSRMFLFVVSAPVFYLLWLESKKLAEKLNDGTKDLVAPAYFAGASLLILEFISLEINASVFEPTIRSTLISVVWVALAIAYVLYGFRAKLKESRITGFGFFAFAIMKVVLFDLSHLEIFYRIISFFVLGIVLLAAAFLYKKYEKQFA